MTRGRRSTMAHPMCVCARFRRSYCTRAWVPMLEDGAVTGMRWDWVERVEYYEPKDCPVHQPLLGTAR